VPRALGPDAPCLTLAGGYWNVLLLIFGVVSQLATTMG
jgi:hypothetical protein